MLLLFDALLGLLLLLCAAQVRTGCNPLLQECPSNPALGSTLDADFTHGDNGLFDFSEGTTATFDPQRGLGLSIASEYDSQWIFLREYIFFGKVDVLLQAAPGAGIVTTVVMQADSLDEIDVEFVGNDAGRFQTNYFSKGDTSTHDRGTYIPLIDPTTNFHRYTIDWTPERILWMVDGAVVRELVAADYINDYPQTPMQLRIGSWVGGSIDSPPRTIAWAGGIANFDDGPLTAYVKHITVIDYSAGLSNATEYRYGDKSGRWESIIVHTE